MLRQGATALLLGIGLLLFASQTRWETVVDDPLIITDGRGYYSYLPAAFIYQDFSYAFLEQTDPVHYHKSEGTRFFHETEHGVVNKYFVGTSVLMAPFFAVAVPVAKWTGHPVDGYSPPFQKAVGVAAIFYLALGVFFLQLFLLRLGFPLRAIIPALLFIVFGTNLLYYTVYEPSMSHVYSFCMVAAFLYAASCATLDRSTGHWVAVALSLGLIVLIRPTNAVVAVALPVVAGGAFHLLQSLEVLFYRKVILSLSLMAFVAAVLLQPLTYMLHVGQPFVYSYQDEGFNFLAPELWNVLFSYRRGLFVYAPILLLAVLGMFAQRKRDPERISWLAVTLGIATWVIASWWMWWYGGGFGHRAFIEYFPLLAIGLTALLHWGWGILRPRPVLAIGILCVALQLVQTYQFAEHILPFDNIDRTKYRSLFLRTGEDLKWYYGGYLGQGSYTGIDSTVIRHDMEQPLGWGGEDQFTENRSFSGDRSACMGTAGYGITLKIRAGEIPIEANAVRVSAKVWSTSHFSDVSFVCSLQDTADEVYFWKNRPIRPQFTLFNEWNDCHAVFRTGAARSPNDVFLCYVMKEDPFDVCVDDLEITFIHAK